MLVVKWGIFDKRKRLGLGGFVAFNLQSALTTRILRIGGMVAGLVVCNHGFLPL